MKNLRRVGLVGLLSVASCASRAPVTGPTVVAAPPGDTAAAPPPLPPDPTGFRRVTQGRWSIAVPSAWEASESSQGYTLHPRVENAANPTLSVTVTQIPNDHASPEAVLQQLQAGYAERRMRLVQSAWSDRDGARALDVSVESDAHAADTRVLGYLMSVGDRFAWAVCASDRARWDALRPGCESTLATLRVGAATPAVPAGRRAMSLDGASLAIPTAWVFHDEVAGGAHQLHASAHGLPGDELHVVLTSNRREAVPARELADRLVALLTSQGSVLAERTRRTLAGVQVDVLTLDQREAVPAAALRQHMRFVGDTVFLLTCAGPNGEVNATPSPCAPVFEGFRVDAR